MDRRRRAEHRSDDMSHAARMRWISVASIVGFVLVWAIVSVSGLVRAEFLPSPVQLVRAFSEMLRDGYGVSPM